MTPSSRSLFLIWTLVLASHFLWLGCSSKPKYAPTSLDLKQVFYSLNQSNFSGYKCEVQSDLLSKLSDPELDLYFEKQFQRLPTLKEKSMLKKLKWNVLNSNEKQSVIPIPGTAYFPTPESKNIVEKMTLFLVILNKVMTLTYLETFADRPDLAYVQISKNFFQVFNITDEVIVELSFDQNQYRRYYGTPAAGLMTDKKDYLEVTLTQLGSMKIPESIELHSSEKTGKLFPRFEVIQGFPQLSRVDVLVPDFGPTLSSYFFRRCEYLKIPQQTQ